jgi:hypothetical protein
MSFSSSGQSLAASAKRPPGAAAFSPLFARRFGDDGASGQAPAVDGAGDPAPARAQRAMWMKIIRHSLDVSIPISSDDDFDDLLARLEDAPAGSRIAAAAPERAASASLAMRDAALETRLSGYIDWLAASFSHTHAPIAAAAPGHRQGRC